MRVPAGGIHQNGLKNGRPINATMGISDAQFIRAMDPEETTMTAAMRAEGMPANRHGHGHPGCSLGHRPRRTNDDGDRGGEHEGQLIWP